MRYMTLFGGEIFEMKEIRYYISDEAGELEVSTRHGLGIWQIAIKRREL